METHGNSGTLASLLAHSNSVTTSIHCRKKTFTKSWGGTWPPWPPWLRRTKSTTTQSRVRSGSARVNRVAPWRRVPVRHNNVWQPAIVRQTDVHPRSYIIERDGCRLCRNRRQLLKTAEDESPTTTSEVADACLPPPADVVEPNETPMPVVQHEDVPITPGRVRSSGRATRKTTWLEDYQCE